MPIHRKRVYSPPSEEDGTRILVDRLWPRGLSKDRACVDIWMKDAAPSHELRRWIHRDFSRWDDFAQRYRDELSSRPEVLEKLRKMGCAGAVTLVYAARDPERNHAVILQDMIANRPDRQHEEE